VLRRCALYDTSVQLETQSAVSVASQNKRRGSTPRNVTLLWTSTAHCHIELRRTRVSPETRCERFDTSFLVLMPTTSTHLRVHKYKACQYLAPRTSLRAICRGRHARAFTRLDPTYPRRPENPFPKAFISLVSPRICFHSRSKVFFIIRTEHAPLETTS